MELKGDLKELGKLVALQQRHGMSDEGAVEYPNELHRQRG
jgi:hypothetical protein